MNARDVFRPRWSPAREIYDAFQSEAELREGREVEEWHEAEVSAVWRAANKAATAMGVRAPTREEIERAEITACGHTDYGAKWAYAVSDLLMNETKADISVS